MENIKKREDYKDVEVGGRKWRIGKFDAMEGSYMLFKIMGVITPLLSKKTSEDRADEVNYTEMFLGVTTLSKQDFKEIQIGCLKVCSEHLAAGFAPVLNENGTYGVIGIERDTSTVLALTVHALMFNVADFFAASPFGSLIGVENIFQRFTKT